MYFFVILLLFNEMQMSVRRFSAIPHLRARLVIHSSIHCTRDRNSSLHIPNYTKPAQISSQNDNLHIFGHLQALRSNIKVMKANNLSITAQSTNCENHMADQDHVTHTTRVQRGAGQQTASFIWVQN